MMLDIKRLLESKSLIASAGIIYTCVITVVFLMPTSGLPRVSFPGGADKPIHLLSHFILVTLWQVYWFRRNNYQLNGKQGAVLLAGSLLYGIIIEIMQACFTEGRTADLFDVIANFSGALLAVFLFSKIKYLFTP